MANVIGNINNNEFGIATLIANITKGGQGSRVYANLHNIPESIRRYFLHLTSLLSPVYWTTATEVGKAVNGYTLTEGDFRREVQVEFATGEILRMTQIAKGVDDDGILQLDVIVSGDIPALPVGARVEALPYVEDYIQTGPGSIYAYSSRMFRIDGYSLPYAWNHSISYDPAYGQMPFLAQRLRTEDLFADLDVNEEVIQYQLSASIAKGVPSNQCPTGFFLQAEGPYCADINECEHSSVHQCEQECVNEIGGYHCTCYRGFRLSGNRCVEANECQEGTARCSHQCENTRGGYQCLCPAGFRLHGKHTCRDINECRLNQHNCRNDQQCENTQGGFRCINTCPTGLHKAPNGTCVDIDECQQGPNQCHHSQICRNTFGGYRCGCPRGYRSDGSRRPCVDIDECQERQRCQHGCQNTAGSYRCTCPVGYRLASNARVCQDIDECTELAIDCGADRKCFNRRGDYECVDIPCPQGYEREPVHGDCVLPCTSSDVVCPPGALYADIITYKLVPLPVNIPRNRDLIRLTAYDYEGVHLPRTTFTIIENDDKIPFSLRLEQGRGVLYTTQPLEEQSNYEMTVRARSIDHRRQGIEYQTTFIIFISVSSYPY